MRIISTIAFFPFRFNSVKFDNVSVKIATITAATAAAACCVSIRKKVQNVKKSTKNRLLLTNVYLVVHIDKGLRYGIVSYTVTVTPIYARYNGKKPKHREREREREKHRVKTLSSYTKRKHWTQFYLPISIERKL